MAMLDRRREVRRSASGTALLIEVGGDPKDAIECGCDSERGTVVTLWLRDGSGSERAPDRNQRVLVALPERRWMLATVVRASPESIDVRPVLPLPPR